MATGSNLQRAIFAGGVCMKLPSEVDFRFSRLGKAKRILRRANKAQKSFVSGETESVANTSAFVGPVASYLASIVFRVKPGLDGTSAAVSRPEAVGF